MNRSFSEETIREWHEAYYRRKGADNVDILKNAGVLFQTLAMEASIVSSLRSMQADPASARILDVGCGGGGSILTLMRLGFNPSNFYGIDILPERISEARAKLPNVNWICGDASCTDFPDGMFDVVMESTMFIQVIDDNQSRALAREMVRVAKPGGHILLIDWRYQKPNSSQYKAVSRNRIMKLFDVGLRTQVAAVHHGALIPPIGRLLSRSLPSMYFLVARVFPFLVGQVATVLKKHG